MFVISFGHVISNESVALKTVSKKALKKKDKLQWKMADRQLLYAFSALP